MSRSYRKGYWVLEGDKKSGKRAANKRVRQEFEVPNNGGYKKVYPSWDIVDYKHRAPQTEKEAREYYDKQANDPREHLANRFLKYYPTVEDYINYLKRTVWSK